MELATVREKFLQFFQSKGYKILPGSSLVPENDPSVLFTTAGMQQFKDFYSHPSEAPASAVATAQPVIRTSDIAEVGDDTHLTSFEMLGNFKFGEAEAYKMKERAIKEAWQFVNLELGVEKERVHATVFRGDDTTPADTDSEKIWTELGVRVERAGREDNFWGPTGDEGPCGPTSEIYIDSVEVWNLVFNQYYKDREGTFAELENQGLDTGSGLERLTATLQGKTSVWQIEPFVSWVRKVDPEKEYESRIIVDHLRAILFLISAGIEPSNKGRGYILRRLIRKVSFLENNPQIPATILTEVRTFYSNQYQLLDLEEVLVVYKKEHEQFEKNLARAKTHLQRWIDTTSEKDERSITELAFYMYESFGFPKELVIEYLVTQGFSVDTSYFDKLFAEHQAVSRAGLAGQFKGGLADHEPQTIKHHTAHHLLLAALQKVLGNDVVQKGSNVTSERLRIDFKFDRKLTDEELKEVETIVNAKIAEDLPVVQEEMSKDEALASGAQAEFGAKYGDTVSVYTIGEFSKELCGGPHVKKTGELGRFEILKEEASSQGIRRIKARCY